MSRTSKTMWIKAVKVYILVLFLILEGMRSGFHYQKWCLLWFLSYTTFILLGMFSWCPIFGVSFFLFFPFFFFFLNHKWVLNFIESFSSSIEIVIWLSFFNLLIWHITLIDLCVVKNPHILGINPTWSLCMIILMCFWIWLVFCWGFLCLCS